MPQLRVSDVAAALLHSYVWRPCKVVDKRVCADDGHRVSVDLEQYGTSQDNAAIVCSDYILSGQ